MKRSFTLIEVLLSSILGVFLITALVQLCFFSRQKESLSSRAGQKAIEWLEAKEQLEESLALAEPLGKRESQDIGPGLFFTFPNGIDIDSDFCGWCKARLWQECGRLFLTVFGKEKERTQELLFGSGEIIFTLWDGKEKKVVQSAFIDHKVRAVIITHGDSELICYLHKALLYE